MIIVLMMMLTIVIIMGTGTGQAQHGQITGISEAAHRHSAGTAHDLCVDLFVDLCFL